MKAFKKGIFALLISATPIVSVAADINLVSAGRGGTGRLDALIQSIGNLITALIPIVVGLAVLVFLWGVLLYVISKSGEDKAAARSYMIWGIVGLFVMVSVWGIVTVLSDAVFGGERISTPPTLPHFQPR